MKRIALVSTGLAIVIVAAGLFAFLNYSRAHPTQNYSPEATSSSSASSSQWGVFSNTSRENMADCKSAVPIVDQEGNISPAMKSSAKVYNSSCYPFIGANPATFVALSIYYSKDATHVWWDGQPAGDILLPPLQIEGADPATFILIPEPGEVEGFSGTYTKDKNHVYAYGRLVEGADPSTFTVAQ